MVPTTGGSLKDLMVQLVRHKIRFPPSSRTSSKLIELLITGPKISPIALVIVAGYQFVISLLSLISFHPLFHSLKCLATVVGLPLTAAAARPWILL